MENIQNKNISRRFLRDAFLLILVVAALDFIGIKFYFYWSLHYYDSVVHFLAGITVGLGSLWIWMHITKKELTQKQVVVVALIGASIIGVLWEIFEVTNGITSFADGIHYVTDTGSDLLMDVCGGIVASVYAWKIILKVR